MSSKPAAGAAGPPAIGRSLGRLLALLDRLFDRLYGSRFNPIYQSGNLAILFFLVTLATGLYLFLFYRIADAHGSVVEIQQRVFLGAWARSMHRYSADLAIVAVILHLLRKLAHGQTWGPRAVAWISGIVLLGVVLLSGWTGLVMVWDRQGQQIAVEGARLADLLPIFSEPIARNFSGETPIPSSFFFMNLFLHVALPLGIAAVLWLHVSRLARPALLPPRAVRRYVLALLVVYAAVAPVRLPPAADLTQLPDRLATDLFFAFWLPLAQRVEPLAHLGFWLALFSLLVALPWLWRPRREIAPSFVDEDHCTGCTNCYQDCPYEAIAMVPRTLAERQHSPLVARVDPTRCVGCGICAGSCAPMGVGPAERTGRDQLAAARAFLERERPGPRQIVILGCANGHAATLARLAGPQRSILPTGCGGSVHTSVLELLLRRGAGGVFLLTCSPRDCYFREGPKWLAARVFDGREAELPERVDRLRVEVASFSPGEWPRIVAALGDLEARVDRLGGGTVEAWEPELVCETPAESEAGVEVAHA
ncbi:MAG: hydrogenase iron-sulfur subunit [Thermoanaerobaculia bacterium]